LFETIKIKDKDDIKMLLNMTKVGGYLIITSVLFNKYSFLFNKMTTKPFKNYIMIHKKTNIVEIYEPKWRYACDFGIFGCQKGGTQSALFNLSKHPDLSIYKYEIHFFDKYLFKGIEWFKKHFDYNKKYVGYKNPDIMYLNELHPILQMMNPFIKIILFLRNPIDRAFSEYQMIKRKSEEQWHSNKPFIELIKEELDYRVEGPKNMYNSIFHLLQRGLYYKQIKNLLEFFPKEHILVLISEDIKNDMIKGYNKVYKFLNVKELYNVEYEFKHMGNYEEEIDKQTYKKLVKYYKDDIKQLEKFIGKKTNWFK
jgi:hypothetical protein